MSAFNFKPFELILALQTNPLPNPDYLLANYHVNQKQIDESIDKLKSLGLDIRDYQLLQSYEMIDVEKIKQQLPNQNIDVQYAVSMPSTHLYLKNTPAKSYPQLCISEHQTNGIGQRNKNWASPFGNNLYFSLNLETNLKPNELSGFSLAIGLAIVQALQLPTLKVKWPNDIYHEHQKLAGILIDLGLQQVHKTTLIISVGINVNQISNLSLDTPWTSLQKITGQHLCRTTVLIKILGQLFNNLDYFEKHGFKGFKEEWFKYDALYQQPICILQNEKIINGIGLGVDDLGRLKIEDSDKNPMSIHFGQASIKPKG
jgi:BirA family biotin operon repressor/biotin-[acetyl-CoA-carboxylase] ligase